MTLANRLLGDLLPGVLAPLLIQVYTRPRFYRTDAEKLQPVEQLKADGVRVYCQELGLILSGTGLQFTDPAGPEALTKLRNDLVEWIQSAEKAFGAGGPEDFKFHICITQRSWYGARRPPAAADSEEEVCVPVHLVTGAPGKDAAVKGEPNELVVAVGGDRVGSGSPGGAAAMPGVGGTGVAIPGK